MKFSTDGGSFQVSEALTMMSQGDLRITMDSGTLEELARRHIKIKIPALHDVPLRYVLDSVLLPQLPGPQQWSYERFGKSIVVRRRTL